MFSLTLAAAQQIRKSAAQSGTQDMALRVAAKLDSEGTLQYGMGFDEPCDEDMKLDLYGIAVVIADQSQELLAKTVLDFVELEPGDFQFIFGEDLPAPSAEASTGCGSSACASGGCASKGRVH
jgi:iron-sulfur cluster assembly protein